MAQKYDSIIFDLGGVLYDIDVQRTKDAFAAMGVPDFNQLYTLKQQVSLFDQLEKGQIDEAGFAKGINAISGKSFTVEEVRKAWNALLIGMPDENIELLQNLKAKGSRLYLLSNTNTMHYNAISEEIKEKHELSSFEELFHKAYYSFQIGMRKPDLEIYRHVVQDQNLDPTRTVFIDDNEDNIKAALEAGIHAVLMPKGGDIQKIVGEVVLN